MKKLFGLLCVLVVAGGCATGGAVGKSATATAKGCTEITDPDGPVICVDDSVHPPKLSNDGKKLHVHSKLAGGGPVYVTWKTSSGGALDIKVEPDPASGKKCYKSQWPWKYCSDDTCGIKVNPGAARGQCQYNLWVNGEKADPIIIVDEWPFVPPPSAISH
jgi:hypothetical protein